MFVLLSGIFLWPLFQLCYWPISFFTVMVYFLCALYFLTFFFFKQPFLFHRFYVIFNFSGIWLIIIFKIFILGIVSINTESFFFSPCLFWSLPFMLKDYLKCLVVLTLTFYVWECRATNLIVDWWSWPGVVKVEGAVGVSIFCWIFLDCSASLWNDLQSPVNIEGAECRKKAGEESRVGRGPSFLVSIQTWTLSSCF